MSKVSQADLIAFGTAVKRARSLRGWTLDMLGAKIEPQVGKSFLSDIENGKRSISLVTTGKLIAALDLEEQWIEQLRNTAPSNQHQALSITQYNKVNMKIFISHSSKNKNYGQALVKLLTGLGINSGDIIFTSDTSYGIPAGENIFDWLKSRISEKPFVIYLLSPEYYSSVACLNEMGAAWVIENKHRMIFTPDFDIDGDNFKNGALDPREMGFFINDRDRVTEFVENTKTDFNLTINSALTNRKIAEFLNEIEDTSKPSKVKKLPFTKAKTDAKTSENEPVSKPTPTSPVISEPAKSARNIKQPPVERYFQDLANGKLQHEEVMIVYYAADTAQYKLGVGWRTGEEVERIQAWEGLNDLGDTLSKRYEAAIKRLEMRNLTEVSEVTVSDNPRQVKLVEELRDKLLDLPDSFYQACDEIVSRALEEKNNSESNDFPF